MWLPTSIYERIPQFYVLAGLLLITDGLYLGYEMTYSFAFSYFYFGLGVASLTYGVGLFVVRATYRKAKQADQAGSADCESAAANEDSAVSPGSFDHEITTEQSVQR